MRQRKRHTVLLPTMDSEEDEDLNLVRASASLLSDLETSLPKLLWNSKRGRVHRYVRLPDLTYITGLVLSA